MGMRSAIGLAVCVITLLACKQEPDEMALCHQLEQAGVAKGCVAEDPPNAGMWSASKKRASFDLVNVPGEKGNLALMKTEQDAINAVDFLGSMSMLTGNRFLRRGRIVFQMNHQLPEQDFDRVKAVADTIKP